MTKRERLRVVELLLCAADMGSLCAAGYATGHCDGINPCSKVYALAGRAYAAMPGVVNDNAYYAHSPGLLEAAARVEEGSWP